MVILKIGFIILFFLKTRLVNSIFKLQSSLHLINNEIINHVRIK